MRSQIWPLLFLCMILGIFGAFSWLTHHPDAAIVQRAVDWPVVGPAAEAFRQLYSPVPLPFQQATVSSQGTAASTADLGIDGAPALGGHVWVEAGQPLRPSPDANAKPILQIESVSNLIQLEQRGDWYKVWTNRHQVEGWVHLPKYYEREPPMGMAPDPPGPLRPKPADPALLQHAFELFEGQEQSRALGRYTLYTDVDDEPLIRSLAQAASQMDSVYSGRYGRVPLATPTESIVLYAREDAYRVAQQRSQHLHGLDSTGHVSHGIVFFFVGNRRIHEVRATLVHELGHLLSRRAIGPALPPWLDEGLADDLANGKTDLDGTFDPSRLGGVRLNFGDHQSYVGGWASLLNLQTAIEEQRMPKLDELLSYDWNEFVRSDARLHYDTAAFFIRFLLDAEDGASETQLRAGAFRAFLNDVAGGKDLTPELLRQRLDEPWATLDAAFRGWLVAETHQLRSNPR